MSIVSDLEIVVIPALHAEGYELIELQYRSEGGQWVLRLFVDHAARSGENQAKRPSITLEDCQKISHFIGTLLEESPLVRQNYHLEVSSPGINRPLKNVAHYQRFLGQKVKLSLFSPLSETKIQKNFSGLLLGCENEIVEIEDVVSGKVAIPLAKIAKAHLDII